MSRVVYTAIWGGHWSFDEDGDLLSEDGSVVLTGFDLEAMLALYNARQLHTTHDPSQRPIDD